MNESKTWHGLKGIEMRWMNAWLHEWSQRKREVKGMKTWMPDWMPEWTMERMNAWMNEWIDKGRQTYSGRRTHHPTKGNKKGYTMGDKGHPRRGAMRVKTFGKLRRMGVKTLEKADTPSRRGTLGVRQGLRGTRAQHPRKGRNGNQDPSGSGLNGSQDPWEGGRTIQEGVQWESRSWGRRRTIQQRVRSE